MAEINNMPVNMTANAGSTTGGALGVSPIVKKAVVLRALGISSATLYRLIRSGRFPKALKIGDRSVGWLQSDIADYIEELKQARFSTN